MSSNEAFLCLYHVHDPPMSMEEAHIETRARSRPRGPAARMSFHVKDDHKLVLSSLNPSAMSRVK